MSVVRKKNCIMSKQKLFMCKIFFFSLKENSKKKKKNTINEEKKEGWERD